MHHQTIYPKTPIPLPKAAKHYHLPLIPIPPSLSKHTPLLHHHPIDALFTILPGLTSLSEPIRDAAIHLHTTPPNIPAT
ncbi:glycerate kinase, partial [Bacillus pumilus]|uniref:glycerate kinase n=1 Tax=Bacillus pumilus TaxID=1408 RepID=UPI003703F65C